MLTKSFKCYFCESICWSTDIPETWRIFDYPSRSYLFYSCDSVTCQRSFNGFAQAVMFYEDNIKMRCKPERLEFEAAKIRLERAEEKARAEIPFPALPIKGRLICHE